MSKVTSQGLTPLWQFRFETQNVEVQYEFTYLKNLCWLLIVNKSFDTFIFISQWKTLKTAPRNVK